MAEDGLDPKEATGRAMDEVQGPVVAIAFTLASVFVPVAGLGGMTGGFYIVNFAFDYCYFYGIICLCGFNTYTCTFVLLLLKTTYS